MISEAKRAYRKKLAEPYRERFETMFSDWDELPSGRRWYVHPIWDDKGYVKPADDNILRVFMISFDKKIYAANDVRKEYLWQMLPMTLRQLRRNIDRARAEGPPTNLRQIREITH